MHWLNFDGCTGFAVLLSWVKLILSLMFLAQCLKKSALTSAPSALKTKYRQGHSVACFSKLFFFFFFWAVNCVATSDVSSHVKSQRFDPSQRYPFGPLFFLCRHSVACFFFYRFFFLAAKFLAAKFVAISFVSSHEKKSTFRALSGEEGSTPLNHF